MRRLVATFALVAIAAGAATAVQAAVRSATVYRDGSVRYLVGADNHSRSKDQAYCSANPAVLFHYTETISPTPTNGQIPLDRGSGVVAIAVSVNLDEMCAAGETTLRLDYGVLSGGTAVAGTDYTDPGTTSATFPSVAQYAAGILQSASFQISLIASAPANAGKTIPVGFRGGSFLTVNNGAATAGSIAAQNVPLATVVIQGSTVGQLINSVTAASGSDPVARATAAPLVNMCVHGDVAPGLQIKCNNIVGAAQDPSQQTAVATALRGLANEESSSQSESVTQTQAAQTGNIGQRLTALRGGARGLSLNGVTLQQDGVALPLNFIDAVLMKAGESDAADADAAAQAFGTSRWGAFVNGSIGHGSRDRTGLENGFDQDTTSLTAGADYRFTPHFIGGFAYTWSRFNSDLGADSGKLDTHARAISGYATLDMERWYLQGSYGSGPVDFNQQRVIRYTVGSDSENAVALSSPSGHANNGNVEFGWYLNHEAWSFTPNLRMDYERITVDGYAERNAGDFNLVVNRQSQESLRYSLGANVGRTFSTAQGVLIPSVDLRWFHETKNDTRFIISHFLEDPEAVPYQVATEAPDRSYGTVTIGLQAVFAHGVQGYVNYERLFGEQNYSNGIFNLGLRFEL